MPTDIEVWQKTKELRSSLNSKHTLKVWQFWHSHTLYYSILFIHFNSKCQNKRLYNKTRPSSNSHTKYLISPWPVINQSGLLSVLQNRVWDNSSEHITFSRFCFFCIMFLCTIALNTSDFATAARPYIPGFKPSTL